LSDDLENSSHGAIDGAQWDSGLVECRWQTEFRRKRLFNARRDAQTFLALKEVLIPGPTFDMSGGPKDAKQPLARPLDGGLGDSALMTTDRATGRR
jgi:hypothetical protein